jgi:hypothetical protein
MVKRGEDGAHHEGGWTAVPLSEIWWRRVDLWWREMDNGLR